MSESTNKRNYKFWEYRGQRFVHQRHIVVKHQDTSMSESTNKKNYKFCEYCGQRFVHQKYLQRHIVVKHQDTSMSYTSISSQEMVHGFQCDHCGKRFVHQKNLQSHIEVKHQDTSTSDSISSQEMVKSLECDHCGKRFLYKNELQTHVVMLHKTTNMSQSSLLTKKFNKHLRCEHCGRRFLLKKNFEKHVMGHQNTNLSQTSSTPSDKIEKRFQCHLCGLSFLHKIRLQNHMMMKHLNKPNFKCGECSFASYSVLLVNYHWKRMHSGLPNISNVKNSCDLCAKTLDTKQALREHVARRHSDILQCHLCEDRVIFLTVKDLETHFHYAHGTTAWRKHQNAMYIQAKRKMRKLRRHPETNEFTCYVCKLISSTEKETIQNHVVLRHCKILRFRCDFCFYQTSRMSGFDAHKLHFHPNTSNTNRRFPRKLSKNQRVKTLIETCKEKAELLEMNTEIVLPDLILGPNEVEIKSEDTKVWNDGSAECCCGTCKELSSDEHETTRQHVRALHGASKCRFQCIVCGYGSSDLLPLKQHIGTQHLVREHCNTFENKCQLCSQVLDSVEELQVHIKENHYSEFACSECGQNYTRMVMLKEHFVSFHGLGEYKQFLVDKVFEVESRFQIVNRVYTCHICRDEHEMDQKSMLSHMLSFHFLITRLACTLCSFSCQHLFSLRKHMFQKHFPNATKIAQERKFGCWQPEFSTQPSSSKKNNTPSVYFSRTHVFHNTQVQNISGNVIEDLIDNPSGANEVENSSVEIVAENRIDDLGDNLYRKNIHSLKIHCPICKNQAFETIRAVREHFSSNHDQGSWQKHKETIKNELSVGVTNLKPNPTTGLFQCFLCSGSVQEKDALRQHINYDHLFLNEMFKCKNCSFVCNSFEGRIAHVKRSHIESPVIHKVQKPIEENCTNSSSKNFSQNTDTNTGLIEDSQNTDKTTCRVINQVIPSLDSTASHIQISNVKFFQTYLCEICRKFFTHEFIIETHWYLTHGETEPRYTRAAPPTKKLNGLQNCISNFPCRFCATYFFKTQEEHTSHVAEKHRNIHSCSACDFKTVNRKALQSHMKVKHTTLKRTILILPPDKVLSSRFKPSASNLGAEKPKENSVVQLVQMKPFDSDISVSDHVENQEASSPVEIMQEIEFEKVGIKEQSSHSDSENYNNKETVAFDFVEMESFNTDAIDSESRETFEPEHLQADPNIKINQEIPKFEEPTLTPSKVSTKADPDIMEINSFTDFEYLDCLSQENSNTKPTPDMIQEVLDLVIKDEPLIDNASEENPEIIESKSFTDFQFVESSSKENENTTPPHDMTQEVLHPTIKDEPLSSIAPEVPQEDNAEDPLVSSSVSDSELTERTNEGGSTFVLVNHVHGEPVDPTTHELPAPLIRSESKVQADDEAMVQEALLNIRNVPRDPRLGYQCFICGKYLKSDKQKFSSHVVEYHMRIEKFECRYCSAKFFSEEWAVVHHDKEHAGLPPGYVRRFAMVDSADLLYGEEGGGKSKGRAEKRRGGTGGTGRAKKSRADSPNPHPRAESSQNSGRESRPGHNPSLQLGSSPPSRLTAAPRTSGTSVVCCSPDLLAGSGAQGRRVTSRPYPDSLPPVPGGCLPCSVQL